MHNFGANPFIAEGQRIYVPNRVHDGKLHCYGDIVRVLTEENEDDETVPVGVICIFSEDVCNQEEFDVCNLRWNDRYEYWECLCYQ